MYTKFGLRGNFWKAN